MALDQTPPLAEPTIIVSVNKSWRYGMSAGALYRVGRGNWPVSASNRETVTRVMMVARGIVQGLYRVDRWTPSTDHPGRWRFTGKPAPEWDQFVDTDARHLWKWGAMSTVTYPDGWD